MTVSISVVLLTIVIALCLLLFVSVRMHRLEIETRRLQESVSESLKEQVELRTIVKRLQVDVNALSKIQYRSKGIRG